VVIDHHEWDAIAHLVDKDASPLIHELAKTDIPLPEVGYELTNAKRMSIAEAELAWPKLKVAYLLDHQIEDCKKTFKAAGWNILSESDTTDDLIKTLNNK
jgi:rRNA maturation endonuclease Nob1